MLRSGGIAFIVLMLSAAALDGDNMIIPGAGCLASALILLRESKRRETMGYKTCLHCGANLDAGEKCDCREETVQGKQMKEEKEEHSYE